jgi:hypothetical protein
LLGYGLTHHVVRSQQPFLSNRKESMRPTGKNKFDPNIGIFVDILTKQNETITEHLATIINQNEQIIQLLEKLTIIFKEVDDEV